MSASSQNTALRFVLVADDDEQRRDGYGCALESRGFEVASCAVGPQVLELANASDPSAIIVSLDAAGSLGLLGRLAADGHARRTPVVVTQCPPELVVRVEQLSCVVLFLNHCSADTLAAAVSVVIGPSTQPGQSNSLAEFPALCPQCDHRAGKPRSITTASAGGTYLGLDCEKCGQQWRVLRSFGAGA